MASASQPRPLGRKLRVVSLLPASTDTLNALVARCPGGPSSPLPFELCGVSHECELAHAGLGAAGGAPVRLTCSRVGEIPIGDIEAAFNSSLAALEEFSHLSEPLAVPLLQFGLSPYQLDIDALVEIRPDVILTCLQTAHSCILEGALAVEAFERVLGYVPEVVHMESQDLAGVYADMARGGEVGGMGACGAALVEEMRGKMEGLAGMVRGRVASVSMSVSLIWWSAPVMAANAWVSDMIEMMGVRNVGGAWEEADLVVWSLCGLGVDVAEREARKLVARRERVDGGRRERKGGGRRMAAVDGIRLFSRPGPLLLESMARLVEMVVGAAEGDGWRWLEHEPRLAAS